MSRHPIHRRLRRLVRRAGRRRAGDSTPGRVYWRALREAKPYWHHVLGLLVLTLLSTPLSLLRPVPLKIAVDSVLGPHPLPPFLDDLAPGVLTASPRALLWLAILLLVGIAVLAQLRRLASQVLRTYTGQRMGVDIRARLFRHAQRLSLSYHDSRGSSDSLYRIQYDAAEVKALALDGIVPFVGSGFRLVAMLYVIALIDVQLAMVAVVVAPLQLLVLRRYGGRLRGGWRGVKKLDSSVMSVVQEVLGSVRVVKAFGQEDRERQRYVRQADQKTKARTRLAVTEGGLSLLIGLIVAGGIAAVLFIGVEHVLAGVLTLGSLLMVMDYLSQLYGPLEKIAEKIAQVQSSLVGAERAFSLLDEAPEVEERTDARPLHRARGEIAFEAVTFSYQSDSQNDTPVFEEVSFRVEPGTRLGISGATGAGKTTLVSLLTRFYDPTEGRILLDGVDLRDYRLADLRNQFAIVLQEPVLFSTSIAENIAYARPEAGLREIEAAARAAHAHDFITELDKGYQTTVGERGMRLSGGERQRISLARAFLKDAPILILDEPTSSVDYQTESLIMEAMERLMEGRTTFMIAHRLSTLDHCDARIRLFEGGVLEAPA